MLLARRPELGGRLLKPRADKHSSNGPCTLGEEMKVAVVGASGFVGSAVIDALNLRGALVVSVCAPRIVSDPRNGSAECLDRFPEIEAELALRFRGSNVVVNAAGVADAKCTDASRLLGGNGILPGIIGRAARSAGTQRYIHVSSGAVQGRRSMLDDSLDALPFSPYSWSKAVGETLALASGPEETVLYRPGGVHGENRSVTRMTLRIARSPFAVVAAPGNYATPQALIGNVGDGIAFVALWQGHAPIVINHPWEGITTAEMLSLLGDREPHQIPRFLAQAVIFAMSHIRGRDARVLATARRLETLWFGQEQAPSWLTSAGWRPPLGKEEWRNMAQRCVSHERLR